jgi:hypothetical protein
MPDIHAASGTRCGAAGKDFTVMRKGSRRLPRGRGGFAWWLDAPGAGGVQRPGCAVAINTETPTLVSVWRRMMRSSHRRALASRSKCLAETSKRPL